MFSKGIGSFCQDSGIEVECIDLVGAHAPPLIQYDSHPTMAVDEDLTGWTVVIEAEIGITTVSDFSIIVDGLMLRSSPVAFVDTLLLRHADKFRVCLDISELVNISLIPPYTQVGARSAAFHECGPGSLFIDYAMRYCTSNDQENDNDGRYAADGIVNTGIVDRFLRHHDYSHSSPPVTMAREMFGDHEAQRLIVRLLRYGVNKLLLCKLMISVSCINTRNLLVTLCLSVYLTNQIQGML
jgi:1,6-anhydro-N-acetylmuramate kinase